MPKRGKSVQDLINSGFKSRFRTDGFSLFEDLPPGLKDPAVPHSYDPIADTAPESSGLVENHLLDSRESGVSQALEHELDSRESGVSQALEEKKGITKPVSSALGTALDVRELGVRNSKNSALDIQTLVGKEKILVFLVCEECQKIGNLETNYISTDDLKLNLSIDSNGLRNLIHRIKEKHFFEVKSKQLGRAGLRKFKIEQSVYQQFRSSPLDSRLPGVRPPLGTALGTALETPPSSSSSLRSINRELLTTAESDSIEKLLDASWHQIDISPLADFRFGRPQVAQIAQSGHVTPEQLQDSINAFAFDLYENQKAKNISGAPLNYFMGILRKGPYSPPVNYESPEDRQQRLYLEAKQKQHQKRKETEEKIETLEFEDWAEKLTLERREELVPPKDFAKPGGTAHNYQLRDYFRENIWPGLRERSKGVSS